MGNSKEIAQSKRSPKGRNFAQSGHPASASKGKRDKKELFFLDYQVPFSDHFLLMTLAFFFPRPVFFRRGDNSAGTRFIRP
jgi:hypothetical protein